MIFLKSLTFILWNIVLGFILLVLLRWLLFNRQAKYIFGKKIPFTPGFLVAKRDWLFKKVRELVHDYLNQASNPYNKNGYLYGWIEKVRQFIREKTNFVASWVFIPSKLRMLIWDKLTDALTGIVEKLLRKTIPKLVEQLQVEHRIDELDIQLSIDFFYGYFKQYVYKPLLIGFTVLNLIIGILNMVWFLIIA